MRKACPYRLEAELPSQVPRRRRNSEASSIAIIDSFLFEYQEKIKGLVVDTLDVWTESLPEFGAEAIGAKYKGVSGEAMTPSERATWGKTRERAPRFQVHRILAPLYRRAQYHGNDCRAYVGWASTRHDRRGEEAGSRAGRSSFESLADRAALLAEDHDLDGLGGCRPCRVPAEKG